jgi:hypothetical protein
MEAKASPMPWLLIAVVVLVDAVSGDLALYPLRLLRFAMAARNSKRINLDATLRGRG